MKDKLHYKCKDMGMKCDFEAKGTNSREELQEIAQVHTRRAHGMTGTMPDMQNKIAMAIRD